MLCITCLLSGQDKFFGKTFRRNSIFLLQTSTVRDEVFEATEKDFWVGMYIIVIVIITELMPERQACKSFFFFFSHLIYANCTCIN